MSEAVFPCFHCGAPLNAVQDADNAEYRCLACGTAQEVWIFPAAARPVPEGQAGALRADASLAPCQRHEDRLAEAACAACGIFLCRGCAIQYQGEPYCADCVNAAINTRSAQKLVFDYTRWDTAALAVAMMPFMLLPIGGIVALAVRYAFASSPYEAGIPFGVAIGLGIMMAFVCGPASFFMGVFFRKWRFSATGSKRWSMILARIVAALDILCVIAFLIFGIWTILSSK
jgi:hypothetical protein